MKKRLLRLSALLLAGTTVVGLLGGCGKKKEEVTEKNHYFKVTYLENLPDSMNDINEVEIQGDEVYYSAYIEGEDTAGTGVFSYNVVTDEENTLYQGENQISDENGAEIGYQFIQSMSVSNDVVYVLFQKEMMTEECLNADYSNAGLDDVITALAENWGEDEDTAASDWADYFAEEYTLEDGTVDYASALRSIKAEYESTYEILQISQDGSTVSTTIEMESDEAEDVYTNIQSMAGDKDGYIYVLINHWDDSSDIYYIDVYDSDFSYVGMIELESDVYNMDTLADGTVVYQDWQTDEFYALDGASLTTGDALDLGFATDNYYGYCAYDDTHYLVNDSSALYLYDTETDSKEEYLNWMEYSISGSGVESFNMLSDGRLLVYSYSYSESSSGPELILFEECDKDDVPEVSYLSLACMYLDSDLEERIIEFNRKHDDVKITVFEYEDTVEDWDSYEDLMNSFVTDIMTDDSIDLVAFSDYSMAMSMASKGLLVDMGSLIDDDKDLSRDDFFDSMVDACTYDGKLVTLPTGFTLRTLIGKASDVGSEPGWTVADAKNLLASKPEGTYLLYYNTRDEMFSTMLDVGYQNYIDLEKGSCNFDCDEFKEMLEFCNLFPEEWDYGDEEDYVDESELWSSGQVLLDEYYMYDFDEIQLYEAIFGDTLTYIGYPTENGNGSLLSLSGLYGITTNCDDVDLAWELLREFYLPADDESYLYNFSARKDDFEKFCDNAMDPDHAGGSWGWGDFEVEIQPATQEQVDTITDLVNSTTAIEGAMTDDMKNIILEEAAYYFNGESTADEVAAKIQSRMEIYISETN